MRPVTYLACILGVMALAFWAYRENYRTQSALNTMTDLQREIATMREDLGVLRAEWAYLNRPERLNELVNLNFDRLQLIPLAPEQFIELKNVDYPTLPAPEQTENDGSKEEKP